MAGKFVRAVFPWYYLLILILRWCAGLIAFAPINASLMLLIAGSTAYRRQYLMPQINDYRDRSRAGEAGPQQFSWLPSLRVLVTQLLAVMAVLLHLARQFS